jgi:conjugal transfer pilus assembly protein TrbC
VFKIIRLFLFLSSTCFAFEDDAWLEKAKKNIDTDAVSWFRKELNKEASVKVQESNISENKPKKCFVGKVKDISPKLFVFISFSVPEDVWISISKDIMPIGGVLVLNGLPENSFKHLANRLMKMKEKGFLADVQINPMLFEEYSITQVPAFVISDNNCYDKIMGNISVDYALEILKEKGETKMAKTLLKSNGGL